MDSLVLVLGDFTQLEVEFVHFVVVCGFRDACVGVDTLVHVLDFLLYPCSRIIRRLTNVNIGLIHPTHVLISQISDIIVDILRR